MITQLALPSGPELATRLALAATAIERAFPTSERPPRHLIDELRRDDERTRFALGAARAGVWEADLETRRVFWSETMHLVMGRSVEAFGGTLGDMIDVVHPDDRPLVIPTLRVQGDEPRDFEIEVRVPWPDGSLHAVQLRGRVVPGCFGRTAHVLGVAQDVTERQQLEQQLRHSQKMEAMGRLAGGVAHDFNNILTAILGYAVLIEDEPVDGESTRGHAAQIRRAAERAAALTRQLLVFSRRQMVQRRTLQLSAVVSDLVPMVARILGEQIEIVRDLDSDLHPVLADAVEIEQIILNLSVNSRDAMPSGGRLTIRTANLTVSQTDELARPPLAPGRYATLTVTDTGTGMDAATSERILEPFFTTKDIGHGTGLGLSTVFEIVKGLGGGVRVTSAPGRGTSFLVCFPESKAAAIVDEAEADRLPGVLTGDETLLVVEDEESVRLLVTDILDRHGYHVLEASTAHEARTIVAGFERTIDLVLADVMMPGGTGPDLMATLGAAGSAPRVLYISGYAGAALTKQGRLDAGSDFLQKPFSAPQLLTKVRQVLDTARRPRRASA